MKKFIIEQWNNILTGVLALVLFLGGGIKSFFVSFDGHEGVATIIAAIIGGAISGGITFWAVKSTSEEDRKNRKYENVYKLYLEKCVELEELAASTRKVFLFFISPLPGASVSLSNDSLSESIGVLDELWHLVFSIKIYRKDDLAEYGVILQKIIDLKVFLKYLKDEISSFRGRIKEDAWSADDTLVPPDPSERFSFICFINKSLSDVKIRMDKAYFVFNKNESGRIENRTIDFEFIDAFEELLVDFRKSIRVELKLVD